ncbi:MAG TPA: hypothetical protein VIQ30_04895 [Pseudonocardia sp.]
MGRVVAWPGSPTHHAAQKAEIDHLIAVKAEVEALLTKVDEYERRGWSHMKLGAFDKLRDLVRGQ